MLVTVDFTFSRISKSHVDSLKIIFLNKNFVNNPRNLWRSIENFNKNNNKVKKKYFHLFRIYFERNKRIMIVPKNLNDALLPITIGNWIMGTDIIEHPLGIPQLLPSLVYSIICIIIVSVSLSKNYLSFSKFYNEEFHSIDRLIFSIFCFGNYFLFIIVVILSKVNSKVSDFL